MSCCGCEETPLRITNLYRHKELQEKFIDLTGITHYSNTFICDPCVSQLELAYSFKERCFEIYVRSTEYEQQDEFDLHSENNYEIVYDEEEMHIYEETVEENHIKINEASVKDEDIEAQISEDPPGYATEIIQQAIENTEQMSQTDNKSDQLSIREWQNENDVIEYDESTLAMVVEDSNTEQCEGLLSEIKKKTRNSKGKSRKSYSSKQKLECIEYAEQTGNRQAAKFYSIDESCIRKWRLNKELLIQIQEERGTKRKPNLHWPALDMQLKIWVKDQMANGFLLKPAEIKAKSIKIAAALNLQNFKGTSGYVNKFMERYQIPSRSPKNPSRQNEQMANKNIST